MARYAILLLPSTNRVYGQDAARLGLAELQFVARALHADLAGCAIEEIGGVEYLAFEAGPIDDHDRFLLSNLSGTYALFARDVDGDALRPMTVEPLAFYGSDLVTIQRYTGKTNEQFTHLLVNLAVAASPAAQQRSAQGLPVRLLDPVCGRGTTLNRGLLYGFDVTGLDLDSTDFDAYKGFLTTYLKDKGIGYKLDEAKVRRGSLAGARRNSLRIGRSQLVELVRGDTINAPAHFGARSFDVLVGDLPYGIQHGSTSAGGLARTPAELVAEALPGWRPLLRGGGALVLAWNVKSLGRDTFEEALAHAGFNVLEGAGSFDHRVDRSISRGVVIATVL